MPGTIVGFHLLCLGSCLARGVVLQILCTDLPSATSAFWCLFNSFHLVIWLECESKVSLIGTTPI
jgi:hypothetical protein